MKAQEAIELLSPLEEKDFVKMQFTDGFSKCCALGHLQRLTSEDPSDYSLKNCEMTPYNRNPVYELNRLSVHKAQMSLATVNNCAPDGGIKKDLIVHLTKMHEQGF